MTEHTAFFYGTLMAPKILYRVCFGTTKPQEHQTQFIKIRPALLHNYRRHRVRWADYPGIVPTPQPESASVLGTYVTGLTPQDISRLDRFEGSQYERRHVSVSVLKGGVDKVQAAAAAGEQVGKNESDIQEAVTTQSYIFLDPKDLEEKEWDFEEFKRKKMSAWTLESSAEYDGLSPVESERLTAFMLTLFSDVSDEDLADGDVARDGTGGRGMGGTITKELEKEYEAQGSGT